MVAWLRGCVVAWRGAGEGGEGWGGVGFGDAMGRRGRRQKDEWKGREGKAREEDAMPGGGD